jgi:hypothetical protein
MKALCLVIIIDSCLVAAAFIDVVESSSTGNLQSLAGKWKVAEHSQHLLDPELVSKRKTGFAISIDKELGDSHRKESRQDKHYDKYSAFLKENGHEPVATGFIRFDYGGEGALVITQKDGSLYLWSGVVHVDNPRVFIGRGKEKDSAGTFVIEWASWCSESPVGRDRHFATVVYERDKRCAGRLPNKQMPAR